ncbi:hypothetical protein SEA_JAMS_45 [Gordonia phage Jams]|nr:hypothetical protein SEA_BIANMAT_45 [Gordonia phage Bianmat]UXE04927.1 hypothetical protein SEA_JAMS_45 [Gordonia phage Jams]UYL87216.1 hypothetical protein SEA_MINOS_46 [Gordonia phage Minos]
MTCSPTSRECCDSVVMGSESAGEGTVVKCPVCGSYWKRMKGWRQLGVFEIVRLIKMGRL